MNSLAWARVAKTVALVGFFLPWVMVSCSGQKLMTASGVSLAAGSFSFHNPVNGVVETQQGTPNIWIVAAIGVVALTLTISFLASGAGARRTNLIGAIAGLVLSVVGLGSVYASRESQTSKAESQGLGAAVNGMVEIHTEYGFWVTAMALGVGAALSLSGGPQPLERRAPEGGPQPQPRSPAPEPSSPAPVDDDVADWDRMSAASDPDELRAYLRRHPKGRFVELALARLERLGFSAESVAAATQPAITCPQCATPYAPEAAFCTECGTKRLAEGAAGR